MPEEKDELLPKAIDELPLEESTNKLVQTILKEENVDEIQKYVKLFNLNQSKKNLLRIIKLNNLLDQVNDQAIKRFEKRPDEISHKELLDYMTVIQNSIDRAQKTLTNIDETPLIQINQQTNEVNINVQESLDRDSRNRVLEAVNKLLKVAREPENQEQPIDVIDVESSEVLEEGEENNE